MKKVTTVLLTSLLCAGTSFAAQKFYCPQYLTCVAQGDCTPSPAPTFKMVQGGNKPFVSGIYFLFDVQISKNQWFTCSYENQPGQSPVTFSGYNSVFYADINEPGNLWLSAGGNQNFYECRNINFTQSCGILISGLKK